MRRLVLAAVLLAGWHQPAWPEGDQLDAESLRFQAELQRQGLPDNAVNSLTHTFFTSPPDMRSGMWADVAGSQPDAGEIQGEMAEIEAENAQRAAGYDAETRRYRDALRGAGFTRAEVDGLTEIFQPAPPEVRKIYWQQVQQKPAD